MSDLVSDLLNQIGMDDEMSLKTSSLLRDAAGEIGDLRDQLEKLQKENFSLAANLCQHPAGDEYGHFYCTEIEKLRYQLVQAKQRLDHIASLTDERGEIGSLARLPLTNETGK